LARSLRPLSGDISAWCLGGRGWLERNDSEKNEPDGAVWQVKDGAGCCQQCQKEADVMRKYSMQGTISRKNEVWRDMRRVRGR